MSMGTNAGAGNALKRATKNQAKRKADDSDNDSDDDDDFEIKPTSTKGKEKIAWDDPHAKKEKKTKT